MDAQTARPAGSSAYALKYGCFWSDVARQWATSEHYSRTPAKERPTYVRAYCCLQESPSGVASCRICGRQIHKGSFRFSWPLADPRGQYGAIAAWVHLECGNVLLPSLYEQWQRGRADEHHSEPATEEDVVEIDFLTWCELYCASWMTHSAQARQGFFEAVTKPVQIAVEESGEHLVNSLAPIESVPNMRCNLLKFQQEGITWMAHQEHDPRVFGGILADEMGMGKTIQTIGLLLLNPVYGTQHPARPADYQYPPAHPLSDLNVARRAKFEAKQAQLVAERAALEASLREEVEQSERSEEPPTPEEPTTGKRKRSKAPAKPKKRKTLTSKQLEAKITKLADLEIAGTYPTTQEVREIENPEITREGATLVVAPLAAVLQWQSELAKFAPTLSVLVYHGANRNLLVNDIERADVVITTYSTIESDYRKIVTKHKLRCEYCGKMFLPTKLRLHLRDMCGPDAERTAKQALRERKNDRARVKAMDTVHNFAGAVPTISNMYKEILIEAGRIEEAMDYSAAPWLGPPRRRRAVVPLSPANTEDNGDTESPERDVEFATDEAHESSLPNDLSSVGTGDSPLMADAPEQYKAALSAVVTAADCEPGSPSFVDGNRLPKFLDASPHAGGPPGSMVTDDTGVQLNDTVAGERADVVMQPSHEEMVVPRETQLAGEERSGDPVEVDEPVASGVLRPSAEADADALITADDEEAASPEVEMGAETSQAVPDTPIVADGDTVTSPLADDEAETFMADGDETKTPIGVRPTDDTHLKLNKAPEDGVKTEEIPDASQTPSSSRVSSRRRKLKHLIRGDLVRMRLTQVRELYLECAQSVPLPTKPKKQDYIDAVMEAKEKRAKALPARRASQEKQVSQTRRRSATTRKTSPYKSEADLSDDDDTLSDDTESDSFDDESFAGSSSDLVSLASETSPSTPISPPPVVSSAKGKKAKGGKPKAGKPQARLDVDAGGDTGTEPSSMGNDIELGLIDLSASCLHAVKWNRIVLDEAHRIKSHSTNTSKSIFALKSCGTRWCLSGTPLQNRVHELYSLLRFLQFYPYAYYFCNKKGCHCASLNYSFEEGSYCVRCTHTKMVHYSFFNRKVAKPIVTYGAMGEGGAALQALRQDVLNQILLRRTKVERAADVQLPPLEVLIRKERLSEPEVDFYEALYKQSKTKFDTYTVSGTILHNFAHVFDLLSRLRQAVDHPYMIIYGAAAANIPSHARATGVARTCGICTESITVQEYYRSACAHFFDKECLDEYIMEAPQDVTIGCPVCYQTLTYNLEKALPSDEEEEIVARSTKQPITTKFKPEEFQSSTKIQVLIQELQQGFAEDASSKAIVFSQFTNFLHLIELSLKREGFKCAVFTGALSMESRQNMIMAFNTDPDLRVILISLKAGGEGLNLQVANQIYLMDPWWNPAAEMQAIQRAHRIGQTKKVRAVRVIAKDTIEERILQLQEKKQLVFEGTVGSSNQAFQKLSADDLKFLFQ